jgi:phage tail sheath protein FI
VTDHEVVINEDVIVNSTLSVKGTVNETFDGDGAAVEFTLAAASKPATVTSVKVAGSTVEIVTTGEPTAAQVLYTAATGKLTFGTAPAEGTANIIVAYTGDLVRDTDYEIVWEGESFVISLLSGRPCYTDTTITLSAYDVVSLSAITATTIEAAIEEIDACKGLFGVVPDLICCPGWSQTPAVAAVMAAKAPNIDGLFKAKAVVDIDTDSSTGAVSYEEVLAWKTTNGYTDVDMIVCWPLVKAGAYVFDMSVILCGILARTDSGNNDCPYESPSNKSIAISGMCVKAGTDINLTPAEADIISYSAGVVTALNFDGWVSWGNRAGCWPGSTNAFEYFNSNSRMMDWLCNTFVNRFWAKLSKPLTRVMIDSIVNEYNSWMNGLTSEGKLYGGEIEYVEAANPISDLIAGKFKLHTKMASPSPAERIDMSVEYDIDYLTAAFATL